MTTSRLAIASVVALATGPAQAQDCCTHGPQILWLSTYGGNLYRVDDYATNPTAVLIGNSNYGSYGDLAVDPLTRELYATGGGLLTELLLVDKQTALPTYIGSFSYGIMHALDADRVGRLVARSFGGKLWELDKQTGQNILIGNCVGGSLGGLAFDRNGTLWGSTEQNELDHVNPMNAATTVIAPFGTDDVFAMEVDCDGTLFMITKSGAMYTVQRETAALHHVGQVQVQNEVFGMAFERPSQGNHCPLGTTYCSPAVPNSTGGPSFLTATGSPWAAGNPFDVAVTGLPPGLFGYLLASRMQGQSNPPASQGVLCLGGAIHRFTAEIQSSGPLGEFSFELDTLVMTGNPAVTVVAGETWNFQAWHRDFNPQLTSNFSDAASILFH